jgi:RND family efflux transporter MFP subunit
MKIHKSIFLFATFLLITTIPIACSTKEKVSNNPDRIMVKTSAVKSKSISLPILTSGKLYTSAETKLSFKIPGIIDEISVREGQRVKKNMQLAVLDLIEMKAKVKQAESGFRKAERDLARVNRLFADSVATLEQRQNTRTAMEVAESDLKVAQFNLRYAAIRAPEDGKILKRFAEEGELINPGMPVILFGAGRDKWVIRAGVTDRQIIRLQIGDKAKVYFDVYPGEFFSAQITEIEAVANPYTGTFEVELKLDPLKRKLYSGFVGKIEINPQKKQEYAVIPIESLVEGDRRMGFVYVPHSRGDMVRKQEIEIAEIVGDQLLVRSGLTDINTIITEGVSYLNENSLIEIVN